MNILCTHPDKNCLWLNLVINVLRGTTYLKCLPIAISRKRASPTFCLHTQTAPMAAGIYPRPFAKEAQITTQMLLDSTPLPGLETVKKGLILELHEVLKSNLITWATFSQWVQMLFKSEQPKQWALRKSVTALSTRCFKNAEKLPLQIRAWQAFEWIIYPAKKTPQWINQTNGSNCCWVSLHCVIIWHWNIDNDKPKPCSWSDRIKGKVCRIHEGKSKT